MLSMRQKGLPYSNYRNSLVFSALVPWAKIKERVITTHS